MKEHFTIHTGNVMYDEKVEEEIQYLKRQQINYAFILAGAILLLYAFL